MSCAAGSSVEKAARALRGVSGPSGLPTNSLKATFDEGAPRVEGI